MPVIVATHLNLWPTLKVVAFVSVALLLQACGTVPVPVTRDDSVQQQRWLQWHQPWVGVPYHWGGQSKKGMDCSAYVQRGYLDLYGIKLPRQTKRQVKLGRPVSKKNLRVGDLLFFKSSLLSRHVGIYMGGGAFIHVSSSKGVTRSSLLNPYWKKHYWKARRINH